MYFAYKAKRGMRTLDGLMDLATDAKGTGLTLTKECFTAFLDDLAQRGRTPGTLDTYRRNICFLYEALPADKTLQPGTLDQWQQDMLAEGYSPRTVNIRLSVANHLVSFLGRRELQTQGTLEVDEEGLPELTRTEYLRLLSTARVLGKERLYLLVKLFGSTEWPVGALEQLTVEVIKGQESSPARLPEFLRREMLNYARRCGVSSGPLFQTRNGKPLRRTAVTDSMKQLCRDARVAEEKANPRCLRRLWQATQDSFRAQLDWLVEQACDSLLETEQLTVGWTEDGG